MFNIGSDYTKNDIYKILKVPIEKQKGAWDTGYREYEGNIYVFANIGVPGRTGHDYNNHWDGSNLIWYGKTTSHINQPLVKKMINGDSKVNIFVRSDDRHPFTFRGEAMAKSYEDISPVKIIWTFRKSQLINIKEAWQIFIKNAKELLVSQEVYVSPRNEHKYKVIKVSNDLVRIRRLSVENHTEQDITYPIFEGAISRINHNQGILTRRELYKIVVIEAAIVWLLPMLDWDNDFKHVIIIERPDLDLLKNAKTISEAENDIDYRIITRALRVRRGQNKLRENLFYLYQDRCCLTRFGIKDLLHACHIIPHSQSGINATSNAFLFRSDIHDLFDSNLIGINPNTLKVTPHVSLHETEYNSLRDAKICDRIDGKKPDSNALKYRWDIFNSSK